MLDRCPDYQARFEAPFGVVGVRTEGDLVSEIAYLPRSIARGAPQNALAERACRQIERYLDDPDFRFSLPLKRAGTAFQRRVWGAIASIPRGFTRSYGEIARELESGPRPVGQACGANRFPLVIPCHRVVASTGLGGFANSDSGYFLSIKRWLLAHEGLASPAPLLLEKGSS